MNPDALVVKPGQSLEDAWSEVFGQVKRATVDRRHPFREVVLSTHGKDDYPNNRTVILRDFDASNRITIYTDIRSDKVSEIRDHNKVSLIFYHPSKKLQLKAKGKAELHHQDDLAEQEWNTAGKRGAASYTSEFKPGSEIDQPADGWKKHEIDSRHFCVLNIIVQEWEFLQLNGDEHLRSVSDGTVKTWIVP